MSVVFIAGSRSIKEIPYVVDTQLTHYLYENYTIIVGESDGVDTMIQEYYDLCNYPNVLIYASNGKVRNNIGNYSVVNVPTNYKPGTFQFYTEKDKMMAETADEGFIIWDGKSKGSLNDIMMLLENKKDVLIYFQPYNKIMEFYTSYFFEYDMNKYNPEIFENYKKLRNAYWKRKDKERLDNVQTIL